MYNDSIRHIIKYDLLFKKQRLNLLLFLESKFRVFNVLVRYEAEKTQNAHRGEQVIILEYVVLFVLANVDSNYQ